MTSGLRTGTVRKLSIGAVLLFILLASVLLCPGAFAEGSGTWKNLSWTLNSSGTLTIEGTGKMADFSFENAETGAWKANDNRLKIKKVVIKKGVTSIGLYAFCGCWNITDITIPNSVTSINQFAFYSCEKLSSITIPDSVTELQHNPFAYADLTSINVDPGNKKFVSVDGVVFNKSKSTIIAYPSNRYDSYTIPNSVTRIGDGAFEGCILEDITIPDSVTSIGDTAFQNCSHLTSITIPKSVTSISNGFCNFCYEMTDIHVAADNPSFSSVNGVLFNKDQTTLLAYPTNKADMTYTVPGSVASIVLLACANNRNMTSLIVPGSVTEIGESAFSCCHNLTSAVILDSMTEISDSAFIGCENLVLSVLPDSTALRYAQASNTLHKTLKALSLPSDLTVIEAEAFAGLPIEAVIIPDTCKTIGSRAFADCEDLLYVSIPSGITGLPNDILQGSNKAQFVYRY